MIGNEFLFLMLAAGYFILVPLLYAGVAQLLVFRKSEKKPSFWKFFMVYFMMFALSKILFSIVLALIASLKSAQVLYWWMVLSSYLDTIFSLLVTLTMGYLGSKWIKYADKTPIGLKASFAVAAVVFGMTLLFGMMLQVISIILQ